ncbi:MAG: TetR/AcrR family transcriptional regulator [Candidatus Marinimicrobia bacterium]|nr:TetR/AcrR family transcriptional regulator [Candidatus Neomarinimicrobiota bacterium]MBL7047648.1 TetR/AcrR family transcriptional regulator [Candidatus Neomarinimicrobiota bacterium]
MVNDVSKENPRKEQILNASLQIIVQKGYDNSRMDDIVQKSKLSKGAIYWYFKSKKVVFLSLVDYWVNRYSAVLNHIVEEDKTASQQLRDLFDYFISEYEKNPTVFKAMVEFWSLAGRDQEFKDKLQEVYAKFLARIIGIVTFGVETGEFKDLNIRLTAMSIMVNIEGIMWFTLFDPHGVTAREYIETITDFILAGLIKKSHRGEKHE